MESDIAKVLREAGWFPGRDVSSQIPIWDATLRLRGCSPLSSHARNVLREFGGLHAGVDGRGVAFGTTSFNLDPTRAAEEDRFELVAGPRGARLSPLGDAGGGHAFLAIDDEGRVWELMDELYWIASSWDEALRVLIRGERATVYFTDPV